MWHLHVDDPAGHLSDKKRAPEVLFFEVKRRD